MRSKAFARAAHRQALTVAKSPHAADDQAFVDALSDWGRRTAGYDGETVLGLE